jgi:hypothetical protein
MDGVAIHQSIYYIDLDTPYSREGKTGGAPWSEASPFFVWGYRFGLHATTRGMVAQDATLWFRSASACL